MKDKLYKSVILIRYDGKNQPSNKVIGIGIEYQENYGWNIIDTSENDFNTENVLGIIKHSVNKFKDKNILILHNRDNDLINILNKLPYPHKTLYSVLTGNNKKRYEIMNQIREKRDDTPHLNSSKNLSIDVSFFFKEFIDSPIY